MGQAVYSTPARAPAGLPSPHHLQGSRPDSRGARPPASATRGASGCLSSRFQVVPLQVKDLFVGDFWHVQARRAEQVLRRRARTVAAVSLAVLAGGGAVAFAVAPLAPDAAQLPVRTVVEEVPVADLSGQLEALAAHETDLSRTEVTSPGQSAEAALRRLGVSDAEGLRLARTDPTLRRAFEVRAPRLLTVRVDSGGELREVLVRSPAASATRARTHFEQLSVTREEAGWVVRREERLLGSETRLAGNVISTTLQAAAAQLRLPDTVVRQLVELQAVDAQTARPLRKGDAFSVVMESLTADGSPLPWGAASHKVVAVEFQSAGQSRQAFWYEDKSGKGAWFDGNGRSRRPVFLTQPLEFARVTSPFSTRMHPYQQRLQEHRGIDYAAPHGTPVRSIGDGVVEFAGWQTGYGNVVHVNHGGDHVTLYAHLSKIAVAVGQKVERGQNLGAVGATGWATGPHLHFEFRIRGVHVDPQRMDRPTEELVLDGPSRGRFQEEARLRQAKLDLAESLGPARPTFE